MKDIFKVDGISYNVIVPENGIKRSFAVTDTDNAGRAVTGEMIRDIIGTYFNYSIDIKCKKGFESDYYNLYNVVASPVDSHYITVPFHNGYLAFEAYVTGGEDVLKSMANNNEWEVMTLNFIAVKPQWYHDGYLTGYDGSVTING